MDPPTAQEMSYYEMVQKRKEEKGALYSWYASSSPTFYCKEDLTSLHFRVFFFVIFVAQ